MAAGIADLHAILYAARPATSEATIEGAVLTCTLEGGVTPSDALLLRAGRDEELRDFKEDFVDSILPELTTLVELTSGQEVASFARVYEPSHLQTTMVFVLREGERPDPFGDRDPFSLEGLGA